MPGWLTEIIDFGAEGYAWEPPKNLPPIGDIRDAIRRCDLVLESRPTPTFAKQCFAKLMATFETNTKLSAEETRLRFTVWLEACGDMSDGQWDEATKEAIGTMKWMPKPAEFRALVRSSRADAHRRRERLKVMLKAHESPAAAPFMRESDQVRTKGMRDSFRKVGNLFKAAGYERDLAKMEGRPAEEWALADNLEPPPTVANDLPPREPLPESPEAKRGLLQARIRFFSDMGMVDYVAQMKRELAAIEGGGA